MSQKYIYMYIYTTLHDVTPVRKEKYIDERRETGKCVRKVRKRKHLWRLLIKTGQYDKKEKHSINIMENIQWGGVSNLHFRQNHAAVDFHPLICGLDSRLCTWNKNTRLYASRHCTKRLHADFWMGVGGVGVVTAFKQH